MIPEREQIAKQLKAHYPTLHSRYKIKALGLFGSVAKNCQDPASDADIYVEFEQKSFKTVAGALRYLQQITGRKVDMVYPHKNANRAIIEAIKKDVLWIVRPRRIKSAESLQGGPGERR